MKKASLLIFSLGFLFSCGTTTSSVSSSESSKTEVTTTSTEQTTTSTLTQEEIDKEKIEEFILYLDDIKGHTKQVNAVMNNYYNFSASDSPDMSGSDTFTATRYSREGASDITVRKGNALVGESPNKYECQSFVSGTNVYQLVKNEDGSKTKNVAPNILNNAEDALNISFAYSQKANLKYILDNMGLDLISYEYKFPTSYSMTGTFSFSYSLTSFQESNVKSRQISHEVTITLEKSVISKATHVTQDDVYSGGKRINWQRVESSYTYIHGDYEQFQGEIFDISTF